MPIRSESRGVLGEVASGWHSLDLWGQPTSCHLSWAEQGKEAEGGDRERTEKLSSWQRRKGSAKRKLRAQLPAASRRASIDLVPMVPAEGTLAVPAIPGNHSRGQDLRRGTEGPGAYPGTFK